jgi:hypothetical protein
LDSIKCNWFLLLKKFHYNTWWVSIWYPPRIKCKSIRRPQFAHCKMPSVLTWLLVPSGLEITNTLHSHVKLYTTGKAHLTLVSRLYVGHTISDHFFCSQIPTEIFQPAVVRWQLGQFCSISEIWG